MKIRLWLFTARQGNYPEGGSYDTSVLDSQTGDCSDPRQFTQFQLLLQWANNNGERLQQVFSAQEAYTLCSRVRLASAPTTSANAVSVGGTGSAFQGGTFEQGMYAPVSGSGWCGCECSGGGMKIPPVNVYNDPTLQVVTQDMQVRRVISATRNKPIGTVSF